MGEALRNLRSLLCILVIAACGCSSSFVQEFESLEVGLSRSEVVGLLGQPDQRREQTLPEAPFFGPGEVLTESLKPGQQYEECVYSRDDQDFYVWLAGKPGSVKDEWRVVLTAKYPKGAVFEASNQ